MCILLQDDMYRYYTVSEHGRKSAVISKFIVQQNKYTVCIKYSISFSPRRLLFLNTRKFKGKDMLNIYDSQQQMKTIDASLNSL